MRFEERELKPFAEPVVGSELKVGSVYFFVNYIDDEMLIPTMETVVFIGRNLENHDVGRVYFQDIDSYQQGARYGPAASEIQMHIYEGSEEEVNHVFEYEHALDELMRCALKRREAQYK